MKKILLSLLVWLALPAIGGVVITSGDYISDNLVRALMPSFVAVSKPGGDGSIAFQSLRNQQGQFALVTTTMLFVSPVVNKDFGIDPANEFEVVTEVGSTQLMLVTGKHKGDKIEKLLKAGNRLSLGGFGANSICAIVGNLLRQHYGVDLVYVPYKAVSQIAVDVTNGELDLACQPAETLDTFVAAGKWDALVNLGSGELGVPKLPGFPTVDVKWYLMARKSDRGAWADSKIFNAPQSLSGLPPRFNLVLSDEQNAKNAFRRDGTFWYRESLTLMPSK
jgi:tripartite-type tricarboxylate transporter receptor subunit TctC